MNWSKKAPKWPAFLCQDGWAWHPREDLHHCHQGVISAKAELVGGVYEGLPVERVLALRSLLLAGSHYHVLTHLIPECGTCGTDPRRLAQLRGIWRRAALSIHEGAVEHIREAQPALISFWHVNLPTTRVRKSAQYEANKARGIPVRDPTWNRRSPPQNEETRIAQIFWASRIIASRESRVA